MYNGREDPSGLPFAYSPYDDDDGFQKRYFTYVPLKPWQASKYFLSSVSLS